MRGACQAPAIRTAIRSKPSFLPPSRIVWRMCAFATGPRVFGFKLLQGGLNCRRRANAVHRFEHCAKKRLRYLAPMFDHVLPPPFGIRVAGGAARDVKADLERFSDRRIHNRGLICSRTQ